MKELITTLTTCAIAGGLAASDARAQAIQHDSEHYVLLYQYADKWRAEDRQTRTFDAHEHIGNTRFPMCS